MEILAYSNNIEEYLEVTNVVNYNDEAIQRLAEKLFQMSGDELGFIKAVYEYVRDQISHSADISEDLITCSAAEVLS